MVLYSEAPEPLSWQHVKPTLLICWWTTLFASTIILLRVGGRFVRSETLFPEDKMAFYALLPMYARIGCVQIALLYGTNNVDFSTLTLSPDEIRRRTIGSGLVLASRIFYSATLWVLKNTILEFFKRLTGLTWSRSHSAGVLAIRCVLVVTFIAIVISDLVECQPFSHYWQVLPDPGGRCRQGYANLITTGVCNMLTDLLLVLFPVTIIISSQISLHRKFRLVLLFSLSLGIVAFTIYRVTHVISNHGSQQIRSLLASIELLLATGVANALVLGSFVRDRGVKKRRFRYRSVAAEPYHGTDSGNRSGRATFVGRAWGSDADLVRDVGFGLRKDLRGDETDSTMGRPTPAGPVAPCKTFSVLSWNLPERAHKRRSPLLPSDQLPEGSNSSDPRRVSFFDVGGLLDHDGSAAPMPRLMSSIDPTSQPNPHSPPPLSIPASASGFMRDSQALIQDIGGLLPLSPSRDYERNTQEEKLMGQGSGQLWRSIGT